MTRHISKLKAELSNFSRCLDYSILYDFVSLFSPFFSLTEIQKLYPTLGQCLISYLIILKGRQKCTATRCIFKLSSTRCLKKWWNTVLHVWDSAWKLNEQWTMFKGSHSRKLTFSVFAHSKKTFAFLLTEVSASEVPAILASSRRSVSHGALNAWKRLPLFWRNSS